MADAALLYLPSQCLNVLLVEDSVSDAMLIEKAIGKTMPGACNFHHATTLAAALAALRDAEYDVVLLDLSLPDSTDFEGLISIQNAAPKLPVLILTAYADEEMALQVLERGAQDYLFKDKADGNAIRCAMQYAVQRKQFEATLIIQANYDMLTGLANRTLFESRMDMALARIKRTGNGIGVFFLDLDGFKAVNDTHGHAAGDKILQQVAARVTEVLRPYDTAARFGGDEFAVLIESLNQSRDCINIAQKMIDRIAAPFYIAGQPVEAGVSIGIASCFGQEKISRAALMRHADEAMYIAKSKPNSAYHFASASPQGQANVRVRMEEQLCEAFENGDFTLHYQPKIDLRTGRTSGAEALIRWKHPERGILLSAEFLPVAEELGLCRKLGEFVWERVCADIADWQRHGLPVVPVSINLSPSQLDDPACVKILQDTLERHRVAPQWLAAEVPSAALLERTEPRMQMLFALRRAGIALHLDHFGASAFSLASLNALKADTIKISPDIVKALNEAPGDACLAQTIIDIAANIGATIVATGIENEEQQAFFKARACKEGQGFALCKPLPEKFFQQWLGN